MWSVSTTTKTRNTRDLRTFALEREVFSEMAAFVVSSKHDDPVWGVDFEGVEVQQTLGVGVGSVKVPMDIREEREHTSIPKSPRST